MADEPKTVVAAAEHSDAIQADALATAADTAQVAAHTAVANAQETAAQLAAVAAEHAQQLEEKTAEHVAETKDELAWHKEAMAALAQKTENLSSVSTATADRLGKVETLLSALAEKLLTPPASEPEAPTVNPAQQSNESGEDQEKKTEPLKGRARHRLI